MVAYEAPYTRSGMWGIAKSSLSAVFSRRFWSRLLPIEAMRAWFSIRRPGWHISPDPDYVKFRLVTAYGSSEERPPSGDVNEYLIWRRRHRRARK